MVVDGGGLQRKTVTSILMAGCLPFRLRYCFPAGCTGSPSVPVIVRTKTSGSVYWPAFFCVIIAEVLNAKSSMQSG